MTRKPERLPPDSATILERSRGVIFARWQEVLRLRLAVLKTSDLEDIHDLRVASRRFRAAFELYYPLAPPGAKTELKKDIRRLTHILGDLRNIDEALVFFRQQADCDAVAAGLCTLLEQLRPAELKHVRKTLKAFDHRSLERIVRETAASLNDDFIAHRNRFSLLAYLSDVSIRRYLPIHQLLSVCHAPESRTSRHALRIAVKKWRYFLELVQPVLDRDYAPVLGLLKEYQALLGRMNDMAEFGVLLRKQALSNEAKEYAAATLAAEEARLMAGFTELVEQRPLAYTFLI
ncbi:CHAD domain-containing protein [Geobacter sp. SVR]|uniref:CHAD domain-containing protein n=1 Tax=Geobacter sp. SVR TaxID=2495594 RepID=UPI00143EF535|nr:CHAD domain-containing protein [Geobacter sp. SVR]BCS55943.1 CHAD domain-containing protein [Geobacter sp. SVR]GCF84706.1 CHAD domain-containing protein [Geobacter sp. SVR]